MEEPQFRQIVSAALRNLAGQIDAIDTDDLDWKQTEGVLQVDFEDGGVFVLSQQVPVRELWLSAFSKAWHFRYGDDTWKERDSREALESVLSTLFTRKLATPVRFTSPG